VSLQGAPVFLKQPTLPALDITAALLHKSTGAHDMGHIAVITQQQSQPTWVLRFVLTLALASLCFGNRAQQVASTVL
jgi:hypothetical protein